MDTFFGYYFRFIHLFHGVKLTIFFHDHTPNFTEPTFTDDVVEFKMRATDFNIIEFLLVFLLDDNFVLLFVPVGELGEIDFQAILGLFKGFLTESGIAAGMVLLNFLSRRHYDYALFATGLLNA